MDLKGVQNQNEARNVENKDFPLGSDGKGDSVGRKSQGHLCYNVVGNLSAFCLCLETLLKAEFGRNSRPLNLQALV